MTQHDMTARKHDAMKYDTDNRKGPGDDDETFSRQHSTSVHHREELLDIATSRGD